jgi:hypothetical protein
MAVKQRKTATSFVFISRNDFSRPFNDYQQKKSHQTLHRKTKRLYSLEPEWSGVYIADFNWCERTAEWSGGEALMHLTVGFSIYARVL